MASKRDYILKTCDLVATQCRAAFPSLDLHFIVHAPGELAELMDASYDRIRKHRVRESAAMILEKTPMIERSSLLGMAMKSSTRFFGFGKRHDFLGIININMDDIEDSRDGRHLIYHLAYHAIDLMFYRLEPANLERFADGPMIPKRTPINTAFTNLKADLFAVSMNVMQGQKGADKDTAKTRAMQSITTYRAHRVEDYPYVIAAEAVQYALSSLENRGMPPANQIVKKAKSIAQEITEQIEESQIKQWQAFASPAQNMAWAGHQCEEILGAAVNTSENPYIRATGYLVAEYTDIQPLSASTMMSRYNSFTSFERNERLHKERMESIFEAALSKSLHDLTGNALNDAAHGQNEELAQGNILGWCADALQVAGKTFDSSLPQGKELAANAARDTFQQQKEKTAWDDLTDLHQKIIEEKRDGYEVTLTHLADICEEVPALSSIRNSVQATINDPSYQAKLKAANDLSHAPAQQRGFNAAPRGPAPKALAPATPAPRGPAPVMAGPSMGGPTLGGSSSQMVRARELMRAKRMAVQQAQDTKE